MDDTHVDMIVRDYRAIVSRLGTNQETTAALVQAVILARAADVFIEAFSRQSNEMVAAIYHFSAIQRRQ